MSSAIGRRVAVYWPAEDEWYEGTVAVKGESPSRANDNTYNGVGYRIDYDDGDVGWVADLSTARFFDVAGFTEESSSQTQVAAPHAVDEEVAVEDNDEEFADDEAHKDTNAEPTGLVEESEDGGSPSLDNAFDEWGGVNLNEILEETRRQQAFLDEFDKRYGPGLSGPSSPTSSAAAGAAVVISAALDDADDDDGSDDSAFVALDLPASRSNAFNNEALPLESPLEAPDVGPLPAPKQRQPFFCDEVAGSDAYRTMLAAASAQVPAAVGSHAVLDDDDDEEEVEEDIQERWAAARTDHAIRRSGPYVAGRTSLVQKGASGPQGGSGKSKLSSVVHGSAVTSKTSKATAVAASPRRIASISGCASAIRFELMGATREVQRHRLRVRVLFMEPPPPLPRTKASTNRSGSRRGHATSTAPRNSGVRNEGAFLMLRAKSTIATSNPVSAQNVAAVDGSGTERLEWRFDGDGSKKSRFAFEADLPPSESENASKNLGHLMFVAYEDLGARGPPSSSGSGGGHGDGGGGLRFVGQAVVALAEVVATTTDGVSGWLPLTLRDGAPIKDMSGGFVALSSRNSTPQRYCSSSGNSKSSRSTPLEVTSAEVRMSVRVAISGDEAPAELKSTSSARPKASSAAPSGANRAATAVPAAAEKPPSTGAKSLTGARRRAEEARIAKSNVHLQRALGHTDGPYAPSKVSDTAHLKPSTSGTNEGSFTGVKLAVNVDGPHGNDKSSKAGRNGRGTKQGELIAQVEALITANSAKASAVADLRAKALHGRVVASKNKQLLAQLSKALTNAKQRTRSPEDHRRLTLRAEAKGDDDDDAQSKHHNEQHEGKLDGSDDESKAGADQQKGIGSGETEAQQMADDPAMRDFPIPQPWALELAGSNDAEHKVDASPGKRGGELELLEKRYAVLWSKRASLVASIRKSKKAFDRHRAARKASEAALEEAHKRKASDDAARRSSPAYVNGSFGGTNLLEQAGDNELDDGASRDERTSHGALTPLQAARRDLEHEKASLEARRHHYHTLRENASRDVDSGEIGELAAEANALRAKVKRKETKLALARRQLEEAKSQHANLVASGGEQRLAAAAQALSRAAARLRAREEGRGAGAAWAEAEVHRIGHESYGPLHNESLRMSAFEGKSADSDDESKAPHKDS